MMQQPTAEWRYRRIRAVETFGWGYAFRDDVDRFAVYVLRDHGVQPRVGDAVAYYGHFNGARYIAGNYIELLKIGERVVWDHRDFFAPMFSERMTFPPRRWRDLPTAPAPKTRPLGASVGASLLVEAEQSGELDGP